MQQLVMPLSDQEEAILQLLRENERLKHENDSLKKEIKELLWSIEERD